MYECYRDSNGYTCLVLVNGREYRTDLAYESEAMARENAALRAFMVCRNFSVNGGMLARNGVIQGLPIYELNQKHGKGRLASFATDEAKQGIVGHHSSSSASKSMDSSNDLFESSTSITSTVPSGHGLPSKISEQKAINGAIDSMRRSEFQPGPSLEQKTVSTADLTEALASHDYQMTQWLLEKRFQQVAVGGYAWIVELQQLGYSPLEITDELLEKAIHGAWILEPFEAPRAQPLVHNFHQEHCVHTWTAACEGAASMRNNQLDQPRDGDMNTSVLSARQSIEYFCGLGGVRPSSDGSCDVELGSVDFEEKNSKAIVTLMEPADDSTTLEVLKNLEYAARVLQSLGEMVAAVDNPEVLYSISVGGGIIRAAKVEHLDATYLHWSQEVAPNKRLGMLGYSFSRKTKLKIGTTVTENPRCQADTRAQLRNAVAMVEELGTFPTYWELAERQLGIGFQAGQTGVAAFQFNQTWVKMAGITKKSTMLCQHVIYTADLESLFAVQVSVCTGIARRVRIRDLLADVLAAYVAGLVTKPPLWKSLQDDFNILVALRTYDLKLWLEKLSHSHQIAFESLVFAILHLLRDTGIDRNGQNFVIACIQPDFPFHCFKVPCKSENYWTRMLADSEDTATFAYITTQCLETSCKKCSGPLAAWTNSTALLLTAVSCYQEGIATGSLATASVPSPWVLRHSEAYLIGRPDAALFVQVDKPVLQEREAGKAQEA
ncbi:hypothetical protein DL770_002702 [Monosporascus sp. CRB-9-2]|nr:hypothetical protein DL770_002702 [Monosporascus sp. CRB-9-2]